MKRTRRLQRGTTLLELLTASTINVMVLGGLVLTMVFGMSSWLKGLGKIEAESGAQRAIKIISNELRQAMYVSVDASGKALTYRLPVLDKNGTYQYPIEWDGIDRRIGLDVDKIRIKGGGDNRVIARGVKLTDPATKQPYTLFTPGDGKITRQVTIEVAVSSNEYKRQSTSSRNRETIFLRNIPELSQ